MTKATVKPDWVKMKPSEMHELVSKLHKEGHSPAKIGLILRDQHGIPKAKVLGKRIVEILDDAKLKIVSEKTQVESKVSNLRQHIEKNKKDHSASRSLAKQLWIINKLKN